MDPSSHRIGSGDTLIVRSYDDKSSYILQVNGEKKVGKTRVSLKEIIGQPYGAVFELHNRKFYRVANDAQLRKELLDESITAAEQAGQLDGPDAVAVVADEPDAVSTERSADNIASSLNSNEGVDGGEQSNRNQANEAEEECKPTGATLADIHNEISKINANIPQQLRGDNSGYVDTNTAQKLTVHDIARLKEEGLTGKDIIKSLIQNSDTFATKTDFAQAKWLKRKEKKYNKKYSMIRSTPASICEASYCKNREKICSMRIDTLAQVLSKSGVCASSRVLVVETMTGMLVGALAYRMRQSAWQKISATPTTSSSSSGSGGGCGSGSGSSSSESISASKGKEETSSGNDVPLSGQAGRAGQPRGMILALYGGQQPHMEMVNTYNLHPEDTAIIHPIPITQLGPAARDVCRDGFLVVDADTQHADMNMNTNSVLQQSSLQLLGPSIKTKGEEGHGVQKSQQEERANNGDGSHPTRGTATVGAYSQDAAEVGKKSSQDIRDPGIDAASGQDATMEVAESSSDDGVGQARVVPAECSSAVDDSSEQHHQSKRTRPGKRQRISERQLQGAENAAGNGNGRGQQGSKPKSIGEQLNSTGRSPAEQACSGRFLRQGVDSLILACRYRPLPILKQAMRLLAPSSPFVVFHEFLEPLVDCYLYLQQTGLALRMVLSDTWLREFQTLPGRVRPDMFMASTGGFLLTGVYVGMVPCSP